MSLPQIYSYSPALSLLPPSLGSRASKYHFWVVHSGYRVAEVWARLPASCQLGVRHGAESAVAQDPRPGFPHPLFAICVTLGKSLGHLAPQIPHLPNRR